MGNRKTKQKRMNDFLPTNIIMESKQYRQKLCLVDFAYFPLSGLKYLFPPPKGEVFHLKKCTFWAVKAHSNKGRENSKFLVKHLR